MMILLGTLSVRKGMITIASTACIPPALSLDTVAGSPDALTALFHWAIQQLHQPEIPVIVSAHTTSHYNPWTHRVSLAFPMEGGPWWTVHAVLHEAAHAAQSTRWQRIKTGYIVCTLLMVILLALSAPLWLSVICAMSAAACWIGTHIPLEHEADIQAGRLFVAYAQTSLGWEPRLVQSVQEWVHQVTRRRYRIYWLETLSQVALLSTLWFALHLLRRHGLG
jgi:hypothetical protein